VTTWKGGLRGSSRRKATAWAAAFFAVMGLGGAADVGAQQESRVQRVDSIVVEGNERVRTENVISWFGVDRGSEITYLEIQKGIKSLFSTGQFKDVVVRAGESAQPGGVVLVLVVDEEATIRRVTVTGLEHVSERQVRDTTHVQAGWPYAEQRVLDAMEFIRTELADEGIPFARIEYRVEAVEGDDNEVDVFLDVTEGQRVTVANVFFEGNERLTDEDLAGAMSTKSEGFWWFRSGAFDEDRFEADLEGNLPAAYRSRGYLDFEILGDTLVLDDQTGKANVTVRVSEGPQYLLRNFEIEGNKQFDTERLRSLFIREEKGLLQSLGLRGGDDDEGLKPFDAEALSGAIAQARELYANEGYLYAQVNPVIRKNDVAEGEPPTVDVMWQVYEGAPAIVNRVTVVGNDYTYEWVVRNQIFILPGDVYSQDRILRSYQSIQSLGFFETPMPPPDIKPLENGDVDVVFNVKEKQTGSINFGTSVGGGVGLSGFVGYEQPNLFGQAKSGSLRWDFGRWLNSFETSFSDPALFQSRVSGSVSLFNSRDRFMTFSSGRRKRLGVNTRFGLPWPGSRSTRLFLGYGISRTKYELFTDVDDTSLFGRPPGVQSQLTVGITRQTVDHPLFPTAGSRQSINLEANGGLLGGDGDFTRLLLEGDWWVPVGSFGGGGAPGQGVRLALGLKLRGGAVFGNAEAFPFDRFWMGGVQFGQNLRGYDETTITPRGYFAERTRDIADIERLGDAFMTISAEYAIRLSDMISVSAFYDAGNVWRDPAEIDPSRLFRGAGLGVQLVTPFGPIGLDYAYGFDKPTPGWQLHFRMGPGY